MANDATKRLPEILAEYKTTVEALRLDSPSPTPSNPENHYHSLLSLFRSHDVIWIGEKYSSCGDDASEHEKTLCRSFFRTVENWLKLPSATANLICPAVFKTGSHSRSNANALFRRFLVVESDIHSKDEMAAILTSLKKVMRLRAVVDTAGKSLHGWFEPPPTTIFSQLEIILPAMGLDPALFRMCQPCRLPGALRDGKFQHLIYLDQEGI